MADETKRRLLREFTATGDARAGLACAIQLERTGDPSIRLLSRKLFAIDRDNADIRRLYAHYGGLLIEEREEDGHTYFRLTNAIINGRLETIDIDKDYLTPRPESYARLAEESQRRGRFIASIPMNTDILHTLFHHIKTPQRTKFENVFRLVTFDNMGTTPLTATSTLAPGGNTIIHRAGTPEEYTTTTHIANEPGTLARSRVTQAIFGREPLGLHRIHTWRSQYYNTWMFMDDPELMALIGEDRSRHAYYRLHEAISRKFSEQFMRVGELIRVRSLNAVYFNLDHPGQDNLSIEPEEARTVLDVATLHLGVMRPHPLTPLNARGIRIVRSEK